MLGAVFTLCVLSAMVRMDRTADGAAQLRLGESVDVLAPAAGRVVSVDVGLGQDVTVGQVLARLETGSGPVEVTAPQPARVYFLLEPETQVAEGKPVAALRLPDTVVSLFVLFPGEFRAELAPGVPMELQLDGVPQPIETVIESVEGPEASLRYAQRRKFSEVSLEHGAVLVRAQVPPRDDTQGRVYQDGMIGSARVRLGTQRLLGAWFPELRRVLP
ncbi:biotin/lipoyl-binding protein [Corallococcus soli]